MTVTAAPRLAGPYDGNDVADTFAFDFKIFTTADLQVTYLSTLAVESTLTLDVDYSVSMNEDQDNNPGGSITLTAGALATGARLTITGGLEVQQETDLTNLGGLYPQVIEDAIDRAVMLIGQIRAEIVRSLRVPASLSDIDTDLPVPVAGAALIWNETGDAIVNGVAASGLVGLSSFMANVIQAADAAEARGDIGAVGAADVVLLSGAQTIADVKTFSNEPVVPDATVATSPVRKSALDAETAARTAAIAAAVAPATLAPTLSVYRAAVASTSGSTVEFGTIPSWASEIWFSFSGVSTSGSAVSYFQLGTAGGWVETGYTGVSGALVGASGYSHVTSALGFPTNAVSAAGVLNGGVTFRRLGVGSNVWVVASCSLGQYNATAYSLLMSGAVNLGAEITRARYKTTDAFDAGSVGFGYR